MTGLSLNAKIKSIKIGKNNIYSVSDEKQTILISLDQHLDKLFLNELTHNKNYKEKTFICFDHSLNDTDKANLGLNVELKTI